MRHSRRLPAALLVALAACGDEPGGVEGPTLEVFVAAAAAQGCANIVRCGSDNPDLAPFIAAVRARPEQCAAMFDLDARHHYAERVADGTTRYDPAAATRCLTALASVCDETFHEVADCDDVFIGAVPVGGPCTSSIVCAGDTFCAGDIACSPGTCARRAPFGESCSGRECMRAGGPSACGSFGCLPLFETVVGLGEVCGDLDAPQRVTRARCGDGLFCSDHGVEDATRRCLPRVARGAECTPDRDLCVDFGDVCAAGDDGKPRCAPVALRSEAGGACGSNMARDGACDLLAGLACQDGACVAVEPETACSE